MFNEHKTNQMRHQRGLVLKMVYANRAEQLARMDDVELWGSLQAVHVEVGQNGVLTLLQDLKERGYLKFEERRNRFSGRTECSKIEICGAGCDVVERTKEDAAVLIP